MEPIIAAEPGKAPAARAEALGLDAALLISQSRCSPHVIVVAKVAIACPDKIYPFSGPSLRTRHLTRLEMFIGLVRLEDTQCEVTVHVKARQLCKWLRAPSQLRE